MILLGYALIAAAVEAEGPIRNLLRAIQNDDAYRDTAPAEWVKQIANWLPGVIDGATQ